MLPQRLMSVVVAGFIGAVIASYPSLRLASAESAFQYVTPVQIEIVKFFDNGNIYAVENQPTRATMFALAEPARVTRIMTYHWNNGVGDPAGQIALRNASGETFGPWQAIGEPGQGGVPSAYWIVEPKVLLPAGTYTIFDSNPSTWAQNAASGRSGMATVEGYHE
jgi:hypothetical protein